MESNQPTLFVVAGSNGAGKSTHSRDMLPEEMEGVDIWDFDIQFNDLKKQMVQDGIPVKEANVKANDQVNDWFNDLRNTAMDSQTSFAYEGHFTAGGHWQPLLEAKQEGYFVHMVYLGLKDEQASIHRVHQRVKSGGHYVSEQQAVLNYYGNIDMLDRNLRLPNKIDIYQNDKILDLVCTIENGLVVKASKKIPNWIVKEMPELNNLLAAFNNSQSLTPKKRTEEKPGRSGHKL